MAEQQERRDNNRYDRRNNRYNNRENKDKEPTRRDEEVERAPDKTDRNIAIDVETAYEKTEEILSTSSDKVDDIKLNLVKTNNIISDFCDEQIDLLGSNGILNENGTPYNSVDYPTIDEKIKALEQLVAIKPEIKKLFQKKINKAQSQKEELKEKAIQLLDGQKELIEDNKKLIVEAKYDIDKDKKEIEVIENKQKAEMLLSNEADKNKLEYETRKAELQKEIESLETQRKELIDKLNSQTNQQNSKGKGGNQSALAKAIEGIDRQLSQKNTDLRDINDKINQCTEISNKALSNVENYNNQKEQLNNRLCDKEANLNDLEIRNKDLIDEFTQSRDKLEKAFKDKILGMENDGISLKYDRDTKLDKEEATVKEDLGEETTEKQETSQENTSNSNSVAYNGQDYDESTETALANNASLNIKNYSYAKLKSMFDGKGFSDLDDILVSADFSNRNYVSARLMDMQEDFGVIPIDQFVEDLKKVLPDYPEDELKEVYEQIFTSKKPSFKFGRKRNIGFSDFSKHSNEETKLLQNILNEYNDKLINNELTPKQKDLFDESFARYVKIGALLQRSDSYSGVKGIFGNIFGRNKNSANDTLIASLSEYSDTRAGALSKNFEDVNDIRSTLGKQVITTPTNFDTRADLSNDRGLKRKAKDRTNKII